MFLGGKNGVNMAILYKFIFEINTHHRNSFFFEFDKIILKFTWKNKYAQLAKKILQQNHNKWALAIPIITMYD